MGFVMSIMKKKIDFISEISFEKLKEIQYSTKTYM